MNSPPIPAESRLTEAMASALATLAQTGSLARLHYQRPGGAAADRETGAELLARTGLSSSVEQIIVTAGAQNGLHAIASTILKPGDRFAMLTFRLSGLCRSRAAIGVTLVPLAV